MSDRPPAAPLTATHLARLSAAIAPGSSVRRVQRLRGGLDGIMHAVVLVTPTGERRGLVVRRYPAWLLARQPTIVAQTWRILVALERLDVRAPRPVLLDTDGQLFGTPALVMTRLRGRGLLTPRDLHDWTRQLGVALATIHRAPLTTAAADMLSFLPAPDHVAPSQPAAQHFLTLSESHRAAIEMHPQGRAVLAALAHLAPRMPRTPMVLSHGDYWAGNTLWYRHQLSGVVDWEGARLEDAGADVGYCRLDLALLMAGDTPDTFLRAYQDAAGRQLPTLCFWDLLGAVRALPDPAKWLPGYHDLGRTDLSPDVVRARLATFVAAALDRAG